MNVPFLDLKRQNSQVREQALAILAEAIDNNAFIGGSKVEEFEKKFATFCGVRFGVAVNSGTDALRLAILALGITPGDEIITIPFTFIATTEVITQLGGRVVFVDVDPIHLNLDPNTLESAITPRSRGIIPVHLYGNPAPMGPIMEIAKRHALWVLEDACQAHGAAIDGHVVGSIGQAGTFSFYPTKNMGALGEGGMVTTPSEEIAQKVLALRNHGQSARYNHEFEGYNARLDAIQAAFLTEKLKRLPEWNRQRSRIAAIYSEQLAGVGDITLPQPAKGGTHAWHLYTIRTARRDALRTHLTGNGIGTAVHYPIPLHIQKAYQFLNYAPEDFPVSLAASRTVLSLPLYQGITDDEVLTVVKAVRAFFGC